MLVNKTTAEIFVFDNIGDDGINAVEVEEVLSTFTGRRVIVRINSPGGVADEGIAIYNALRRHRGGVTTVVESLAASAASIIALGGDRREIQPDARMMIHLAEGLAYGNSRRMRQTADILDSYDAALAGIYLRYMDATRDEIMDMLASETWFTASQAVKIGLATQITGYPAATSSKSKTATATARRPAAMKSPLKPASSCSTHAGKFLSLQSR